MELKGKDVPVVVDAAPFAHLFADTGSGFSEEASVISVVGDSDGVKEIAFDLGAFKGAKALKFDPLNGCAIIRLRRIELWTADNKVIRARDCATNGFEENGELFFPTDDPQIHLNIDPRLKEVVKAVFRVEYAATGKEAARRCTGALAEKAGIPSGSLSVASRLLSFIKGRI